MALPRHITHFAGTDLSIDVVESLLTTSSSGGDRQMATLCHTALNAPAEQGNLAAQKIERLLFAAEALPYQRPDVTAAELFALLTSIWVWSENVPSVDTLERWTQSERAESWEFAARSEAARSSDDVERTGMPRRLREDSGIEAAYERRKRA